MLKFYRIRIGRLLFNKAHYLIHSPIIPSELANDVQPLSKADPIVLTNRKQANKLLAKAKLEYPSAEVELFYEEKEEIHEADNFTINSGFPD